VGLAEAKVLPYHFLPFFSRSGFSDLFAALGSHPIRLRTAALFAERLGGLVLAVVGILGDLARQNFGAAERAGYGVGGSFLALRSLRHTGSVPCFTLSIQKVL